MTAPASSGLPSPQDPTHPAVAKRLALISLLLLMAYLAWVASRPSHTFWSLDEGGKFIYLESVLRTGRIDTPLVYPGEQLDPEHEYVPLYYFIERGDQIYSWWPYGFPLLALPFYRALGWPGLYLLPALAGALCAFLAGWLCFQITRRASLSQVTALLVGIATPVAFYSTTFWEHTLSAALVLGCVIILLKSDRSHDRGKLLLAGALASLAVFLRLDTAPVLVGCGIYLLIVAARRAIWFLAGSVVVSLPWLWFNQWATGNPFGPTMGVIGTGNLLSGVAQVGKKFLAYALFNPDRADAFVLPRNLLILASVLFALGVCAGWLPRLRWLSLACWAVLTLLSTWVLLQPSQYQAVHGILLVAPQIMLAAWLPGVRQAWRETRFTGMLVAGALLFAVVYLLRAWVAAGGLQWGPRYLLSLYPLFIVAAVASFHFLGPSLTRRMRIAMLVVFATASLVGVGFQVRGLVTARTLMGFYARSAASLANENDGILLFDCLGFGMNAPEVYWRGNVFSYAYQEERRQGFRELMKARGVERFEEVHITYCDNAPLEQIAARFVANPDGYTLEEILLK